MKALWVPIALLVAAAVSALATPLVSRLALALGAVDRPNERKVSRRSNIPLLGGLAVALGFFVGLAVALLLLPEVSGLETHMEALLIGGLLVLVVGAIDDRHGLRAGPKLVFQIAAAAVAIAYGFQIDHVSNPISGTVFIFPTWLTWLVTTSWIVVVTNSINLIDGLDGLCTGIAAIIAATLSVIAFYGANIPGMVIGVALVGALLGFLPYNFPPARIFIGDTGALFIGYALSILTLEGYQRVTVITFLVPLLALAVPLLDTGLSVLRRLRTGAGVMKADRLHIHHRLLLEHAGSHRGAVLSLYFLTVCFCVIAVSFTRLPPGIPSLLFLGVVFLLTLRILRNLGFFAVEEGTASAEGAVSGPENGSAPVEDDR